MHHPASLRANPVPAWAGLHPWLACKLRKPALALSLALGALTATWGQGIQTLAVHDSSFELAYESLVETIEGDGYVVASVQQFGDMLDRTTELSPGGAASVYLQARVVLFCSARLAHAMTQEDPTHIALCPLSIALYVRRNSPQQVVYAWRGPSPSTPARQQAQDVLNDVVRRAAQLARIR